MKGSSKAETPAEYISELDEPRKTEIKRIDALIRKWAPKLDPHMRSGMIGYGTYHYKYPSGREGDWFKVGLASNKNYISIYACGVKNGGYIAEAYKTRLPKASIGKSCIRFKRLDDLDLGVLEEIVKETSRAEFSF